MSCSALSTNESHGQTATVDDRDNEGPSRDDGNVMEADNESDTSEASPISLPSPPSNPLNANADEAVDPRERQKLHESSSSSEYEGYEEPAARRTYPAQPKLPVRKHQPTINVEDKKLRTRLSKNRRRYIRKNPTPIVPIPFTSFKTGLIPDSQASNTDSALIQRFTPKVNNL
jgi:hypothetical protein